MRGFAHSNVALSSCKGATEAGEPVTFSARGRPSFSGQHTGTSYQTFLLRTSIIESAFAQTLNPHLSQQRRYTCIRAKLIAEARMKGRSCARCHSVACGVLVAKTLVVCFCCEIQDSKCMVRQTKVVVNSGSSVRLNRLTAHGCSQLQSTQPTLEQAGDRTRLLLLATSTSCIGYWHPAFNGVCS